MDITMAWLPWLGFPLLTVSKWEGIKGHSGKNLGGLKVQLTSLIALQLLKMDSIQFEQREQ